jgi:hypothetical protein
MEKRAMKYMCRDKKSNDCFGIGDTPEDALSDYLNDCEPISFNQYEWFELKPITAKFVFEPITPPKPTIKKAKK